MLGSAICNSQSQIVARRFSRRRQDLDADFSNAFAQAHCRSRAPGLPPDLQCRMVWSEADGVPVIADRYGGRDRAPDAHRRHGSSGRTSITAALAEIPGVASVVERNDAPARAAEGLEDGAASAHAGRRPDPMEGVSTG